jgi:uroporphyrinogen III methyltransferase/synthase
VVTFVTGHAVESIDWSRVGLAETLVIFMGLSQFAAIADQIIAHGRAPETPAMAVRWGTRHDQQTVVGTLATLPRRIAEKGLKPPATIIVGDVVALRDKLNWFEKLPLFGVRVAITRPKDQAPELSEKLRALGADAVETPSIEIQRVQDYAALDASIGRLEMYDWLIFTSVNGVRFFLERLDASKRDLRALRAKIAAIGPATRAAVETIHLKVDIMPREYVAESLVEAFRSEDLKDKRVLLPRAAVARDLAPLEFSRMGAMVDVVAAYRTVAPAGSPERLAEVFGGPGKPGWIVFTSSSTARNFFGAAPAGALDGVRIASIGPVTSATVRELGAEVTVEAEPHTVDGVVTGIVDALRGGGSADYRQSWEP